MFKFKKKTKEPTAEELLKEELIAEMRTELKYMSKLDREDIFAVQERNEHLDRLETEVKLLNSVKCEDLKKSEANAEMKKGLVPAIVGAVATLTSAIVLIIFEKDECITGNAAKELLRKIFGGFRTKN